MSQCCMECERRERLLQAKDAELKKLWEALGYIGTVINPPYSDPVSTLKVISNKVRELIAAGG